MLSVMLEDVIGQCKEKVGQGMSYIDGQKFFKDSLIHVVFLILILFRKKV